MSQLVPENVKSAVYQWLENRQWKGADPFDGLCSPVGQWLCRPEWKDSTLASYVRLALIQGVKRSPWNLRSLLRVPPQENAMALAVGILGNLEATARGEDRRFEIENKLKRMLELEDERTGLWGYPFPWQSRAFFVSENHPNLVISSVCLRAFIDALRFLGDRQEKHAWLEKVERATRSLQALFWNEPGQYYSYVEHEAVFVHNASLFGAEVTLAALRLLREEGFTVTEEWAARAFAATTNTLNHQESSGRWSYGTLKHHAWCDNFHTAYNLVSLSRIRRMSLQLGETELPRICEKAIRKGFEYYLEKGFEPDGTARYFESELYPIETHSYAAALVCFRELQCEGLLLKGEIESLVPVVFESLCAQLYQGNGEFAYRRWQGRVIRTPFTRWAQSWIYYGLECLLSFQQQSHSNH